MSADDENRVAVELARGHSKLARVGGTGRIEVVTAGSGSDGEPAIAADGAIAHVSNRDGFYEMWLLAAQEPARRLTSIQGSYIIGPAWSHDGQHIAFVGVKGRRAELYTVSRDGSRLRKLTDDGAAKKDPVFHRASDRLFYLARVGGAWRIMETSLADSSSAPRQIAGGEGWWTLRAAPDGTLYGQREGEALVRRVSVTHDGGGSGMGASEQIVSQALSGPRISDVDSWSPGNDGIYVRKGRRPNEPSALWLFPPNAPARKLADVPLASGGIAVDANGNVVFSQSTSAEIDLAMLELRIQD